MPFQCKIRSCITHINLQLGLLVPNTRRLLEELAAKEATQKIDDDSRQAHKVLVTKIEGFQAGTSGPPSDEEFYLWRAAQQVRLEAKAAKTLEEHVKGYLPG